MGARLHGGCNKNPKIGRFFNINKVTIIKKEIITYKRAERSLGSIF